MVARFKLKKLSNFMYIRLIDHRSVPRGGPMGDTVTWDTMGGPHRGPKDLGLKDPGTPGGHGFFLGFYSFFYGFLQVFTC